MRVKESLVTGVLFVFSVIPFEFNTVLCFDLLPVRILSESLENPKFHKNGTNFRSINTNN